MTIRILIAEDFQLLREDLCEIISAQEDMTVAGMAASGQEAVRLAAGTDFDVMLMDIEMETINAGIKAAEAILDQKPEAKIIFLTAHESDEMVITSMATGALDYVVKGGTEEELLSHIRAVDRGTPMLDARIQKVVMQEYSRLRRSEQSIMDFIQINSRLTPAERALIRNLLDGYKVREIAELRCVEMATVKTQINSLLRKFGCSRTKDALHHLRCGRHRRLSLRADLLFLPLRLLPLRGDPRHQPLRSARRGSLQRLDVPGTGETGSRPGMKIALVQSHIFWEDKERNLAALESVLETERGADLYLLPEMSFTGFSMHTDRTAEQNRETAERVARLAVQHQTAIGFGWVRQAGEKCENVYSIINSRGDLVSEYVKIHPFSYSGEDKYFSGGSRTVIFEIDGIPFTVFICYDLRFPELFRAVCPDVHAVILPANWPAKRAEHWKTLLRARAIENQVCILAVNCAGEMNGLTYSGDSCVIKPDGEIACMLSGRDGVLRWDLTDDTDRYRKAFPVLQDRRLDITFPPKEA